MPQSTSPRLVVNLRKRGVEDRDALLSMLDANVTEVTHLAYRILRVQLEEGDGRSIKFIDKHGDIVRMVVLS